MPPAKKKRSAFWLFMAVVLAVAAAVWGGRLVAIHLAANGVTSGPRTVEELDAWYPRVPPPENAADVYQEAFSAYSGKTTLDDALPLSGSKEMPLPTEPIPADMKSAMVRHLEANAACLALLHQAAALPRSRYPVDFTRGFEVDLSHLAKLRECARMLVMQATLSAANGDADSATTALTAALAAARSLREEPVLVSQFVRYACGTLACEALEQVLNRVALSDKQLSALQAAFAEADDTRGTMRALTGEQCMALLEFDRGDVSPWFSGTTQAFLTELTGRPASGEWVLNRAYKWSGVRTFDKGTYIEWSSRVIEATQEPYPERLDACKAVEKGLAGLSPWLAPITSVILPSMSGAVNGEARYLTWMRAAQAATAIERYRVTQGKLPEHLAALVPACVTEVPKDPYDGLDLRYRQTPEGFIVYGIGQNRIDDGGTKPKDRAASGEGDVVLTVNGARAD